MYQYFIYPAATLVEYITYRMSQIIDILFSL